jgi:hypothetical protein
VGLSPSIPGTYATLYLHVWFSANAIAGELYIIHATSLGLDGSKRHSNGELPCH